MAIQPSKPFQRNPWNLKHQCSHHVKCGYMFVPLTSLLRCSRPPQQAEGFLCPPAAATDTVAERSPKRSWRTRRRKRSRPKRMTKRRRRTGRQSNLLAARSLSWFPVWPAHPGCRWWARLGPVSSAPAPPAPQSTPASEQTPPWCGSQWQDQWAMMFLAVGGLPGIYFVPGPAWLSDRLRRTLGGGGEVSDLAEGFEIQNQTHYEAVRHRCQKRHSPLRSYCNYCCCCSLNEY